MSRSQSTAHHAGLLLFFPENATERHAFHQVLPSEAQEGQLPRMRVSGSDGTFPELLILRIF